jgi:hypothetical protein
MLTFKGWLNENKAGLGMLGLALLTAPTATYLLKNKPSSVMPEVTYNIKMTKKLDGLYYTVVFHNVNFENSNNPALIRQYKREAMDAVIDTVVNMQGIVVPVDTMFVRTASLKGLSYEALELKPETNEIYVVLKQENPPDNLYIP